jgi:hypothetical protein
MQIQMTPGGLVGPRVTPPAISRRPAIRKSPSLFVVHLARLASFSGGTCHRRSQFAIQRHCDLSAAQRPVLPRYALDAGLLPADRPWSLAKSEPFGLNTLQQSFHENCTFERQRPRLPYHITPIAE